MAEINRAVKGTCDILPDNSYKWQEVEKFMLETSRLYGFKEIRVPVFEHTEVFNRSVGDTTDVVQKEMYTFDDKGGRSITLRPELTAGVVRSAIEKGLVNGALPLKVCYIGGCYRYEKPQAGRLREFHQFGVECFGAGIPAADAEVISIAAMAFENLGIKNLRLEINSIGCPTCRAKYTAALKEYFASNQADLCDTCRGRLDRNPMRILDCKSPVCSGIAEGAPTVLDYICDDCRDHFEKVKTHLNELGIKYTVNPKIVRGLDYYTRTVFEFISNDLGAQATLCGGGRYDGLIEQVGGQPTAALGFGMGLERLMMVMQAQGCPFPEAPKCDLYIAPMGENAAFMASKLCNDLRAEGYSAETDLVGRGLKAQMKFANKIGAKFTLVLGDNEIETGKAKLKNMATSEETEVSLPDGLLDAVYNEFFSLALKDLNDATEDFGNKGEQ